MAVASRQVHRAVSVWACQFRVGSECQEHGRGVYGQRLACLESSICFGIDGVGQQRHIAEDLVGIRTIGQQPGQGFRVLVLNGQVCRCPVVTHPDIEPSH